MRRARRIIEIDLKLPSRPPAFAFVEFDSARAADDAVAGRDGYDFHGDRLRVRPGAAVSTHPAAAQLTYQSIILRA